MAKKKTHAMSSEQANIRVQLYTKKASKSSGIGTSYTSYPVLPEEKVNTLFRDKRQNHRAVLAKKKTHAASSGKADNQTQLPKKKADKSSVMEISTIPDPHTSLKREVTNSYGANYVSKLLDNALYQTGSSLDQIPPREYTIQTHQCYLTDDPNRFAYNDLLTAADGMCPP